MPFARAAVTHAVEHPVRDTYVAAVDHKPRELSNELGCISVPATAMQTALMRCARMVIDGASDLTNLRTAARRL